MDAAISPELLSAMIAAIYDSAIDPELWPATMQLICDRFDFGTGILGLLQVPGGEIMIRTTVGVPLDVERLSLMGTELIDLWGGPAVIADHNLSEPMMLSQVNPGALDANPSNPVVTNFAMPMRFTDLVSFVLARNSAWTGILGFSRHDGARSLTEHDLEALRLLIPHCQRAAAINQLLNIQALEAATFRSVVNGLKAPAIIVDDQESILFANEPAVAVLDRGDPICVRANRLSAPAPALRKALRTAIAQCVDDESRLERKGLGIPVRDAMGEAHALHVMPLRRGTVRPLLIPGGAAAIFLASPGAQAAVPADVVTGLFGLTPSEGLVFGHIAAGKSVADTARHLAIAQSTVRTHLLRIFEKTDVHRQADLVALGASFATPVVT